MKKYLIVLLSVLLGGICPRAFAQQALAYASAAVHRGPAPKASTLASPKTYFLVLLKAPKVLPADIEAVATLRAAHRAYLQQLQKEGKLALAGSCPGPDQDVQTMYMLNVPTLQEAQQLSANDPSVKMGKLMAAVYPWVRQHGGKL